MHDLRLSSPPDSPSIARRRNPIFTHKNPISSDPIARIPPNQRPPAKLLWCPSTPLATNIAAISFIGRRVDNPRAAVTTGLLYTVGRTVAYVVLAALLVSSLLSAPAVSHVLQKYMNKVLGPLLILVGMLLVGLIEFNVKGSGLAAKLGKRVETWGIWSGLAMGVVFAMSFCPGSAALFFGSLIPLALKCEPAFVLPTVYGAGTALPVLAFAILIVVSTNAVGRAMTGSPSLSGGRAG